MGDANEVKYEVECKPDKYAVNLKEGICFCKVWDLISVLSEHAIATMG